MAYYWSADWRAGGGELLADGPYESLEKIALDLGLEEDFREAASPEEWMQAVNSGSLGIGPPKMFIASEKDRAILERHAEEIGVNDPALAGQIAATLE